MRYRIARDRTTWAIHAIGAAASIWAMPAAAVTAQTNGETVKPSNAEAAPLPTEANAAQATTPPAAAATTSAQAEAASAQAGDDEIVVTARRRQERLQDVPLSVSAATGEQLKVQGIENVRNIPQIAPGVTMGGLGIYTQARIRGIGTSSVLAGDESSVANYIDGVYVPQMYSGLLKFTDVERVEVLRGPQGTLFGRNATGGAVQVITRMPSFHTRADFSVGYGSFNRRMADGYVTTGLGSTVAVSLSAFYDHDDGYIKQLIFNKKVGWDRSEGVRGKILFQPTDRVSLLLSAGYLKSDTTASISTQPLNGNARGRLVDPTVVIPTEPRQIAQGIIPQFNVKSYDVSAKATFDLGHVILTSLTAYRRDRPYSLTDADLTTANLSLTENHQPSDAYSEELQLASHNTGPLQFVTGVYYFRDKSGYNQLVNRLSGSRTISIVDTEAWAAFGEATFDITSRFSVTGGVRYSYESKHNVASVNGLPRVNAKAHWSDVTPRAVLKYEVPGLVNLYASYSEGFKSGQFNSGDLSGVAVKPEKVRAYEAGVKTLGPVRATAATFYYDYNNIQVQQYLPSAGVGRLQNAATAKIKGAEATVDARPIRGLTVGARLSYLSAYFKSFPNALSFVPTGLGGNSQLIINASGNRMPYTPKWTAGANAAYVIEGVFGGSLTLAGNVYWTDHYFFTVNNRLSQKAYTLVNGNITWRSPNDRLELSAFVNNATNTLYKVVSAESALGDQAAYAQPATFGVRAGVHF